MVIRVFRQLNASEFNASEQPQARAKQFLEAINGQWERMQCHHSSLSTHDLPTGRSGYAHGSINHPFGLFPL